MKFDVFERPNDPTAMRRRHFFAAHGPGPTRSRKAQGRVISAPKCAPCATISWRQAGASAQPAARRKSVDSWPCQAAPQTGASEPTHGSQGEGLGGGQGPLCTMGGVCCGVRGFIGAKGHLVWMPSWSARAPRAPTPSPTCDREGQNEGRGQSWGREGVLGGPEFPPRSANLPRTSPAPIPTT